VDALAMPRPVRPGDAREHELSETVAHIQHDNALSWR
jgi:hypothetical protein